MPSSRAAAAIRARRAELGKTQAQVVEDSGGVLYGRLVSEIETETRSILGLTVPKLRALAHALEWTVDEFARATGLDVPTAEPVPGSVEYDPTVTIPEFGSVNAGIHEAEDPGPDVRAFRFDPVAFDLRGRDVNRLAVLKVNGDSMVSEKAAHSIPNGSKVIVEWGALPRTGDIVVAWVPEIDASVLKKYEEGPETILRSFNPLGPVFRAGEYEIDVRGVVRMVMHKPN